MQYLKESRLKFGEQPRLTGRLLKLGLPDSDKTIKNQLKSFEQSTTAASTDIGNLTAVKYAVRRIGLAEITKKFKKFRWASKIISQVLRLAAEIIS